MREHLDPIVTTLMVSDQDTLRVTLTEANHVYIEAVGGWTYRGIKHVYTAHGIFDGRDWVLQPGVGSYTPTLSYKGKDIVDAQVFSAVNASVLRVPWFEKLRQDAEAAHVNNDIMYFEENIARLEKAIRETRVLLEAAERVEADAKRGVIPSCYIQPSSR